MATESFAAYLRSAREASGLTQAALAERCRLTGSYVSLLESGKKPAPSDRVVRRMAEALGLDPDQALQVAHLDRAPEELRRSVERLRRQAALERDLRERTAEALFPLSLWNLLPRSSARGVKSSPVADLGIGVVRAVERLFELARSSPDLPTYRRRSGEVLAALPAEDRRRMLEAAPELAAAAVPAERVMEAPGAGLPPEVLPGDAVVVQEGLEPRAGEVVLVEGEGGAALRRFVEGMAGVVGVVTEVRRPLRRG